MSKTLISIPNELELEKSSQQLNSNPFNVKKINKRKEFENHQIRNSYLRLLDFISTSSNSKQEIFILISSLNKTLTTLNQRFHS